MTVQPRLLDLFCGAGGAGFGYQRAGFEVVGVDIRAQPHYPGQFVQADAMTYPLEGFDVVHASPPCQAFTRKSANWGRARVHWTIHPELLVATRERLRASGLPYVIENVPGAPILAQVMYCGTSFGLRIEKHRLFEASWSLPFPPASCDHRDVYSPWAGKGRSAAQFREAQGTPWIPMGGGASRRAGVTGDLFNAIPPAYTEHIGRAWLLELAA